MDASHTAQSTDIEALRSALVKAQLRADEAEAKLAAAQAYASATDATIAHLKCPSSDGLRHSPPQR
jgi:hypothetical protein